MASIIAYVVWCVVLLSALVCILALCYRAYGDSPAHRSQAMQLLGGIVVVVVLYHMLLLVMRQDKLVLDPQVDVRLPRMTKIIDGFIEVPTIANKAFDTLDQRAPNYLPLPRSYNRRGGAQFSYQFWLNVKDGTPSAVKDKIILLRGDNALYTWNDSANGHHSGVAIACPSISFGDTYDELKIRFNTLDQIENTYTTKTQTTQNVADTSARNNALLKLILGKWVLFTVVFEDNVPVSEFEDGTRMRLYVNDLMYDSATYPGKALRQNNGQLFLFPSNGAGSGGLPGALICDLSYYNYAVEAEAIKKTYDAGQSQKRSNAPGTGENIASQPLYLSEYNKLDIYTQ